MCRSTTALALVLIATAILEELPAQTEPLLVDGVGVHVNADLLLNGGAAVNEIATDGAMDGGDAAIPTEGAVATYVQDRLPTRVYLHATAIAGGNTALAPNTSEVIDYLGEISDAGDHWNGDTFTAPAPGIYQVTASLRIYDLDDGNRLMTRIRANGTTSAEHHAYSSAEDMDVQSQVSIALPLATGDTIQVQAQQTNPDARGIRLNPEESYITIVRVAP